VNLLEISNFSECFTEVFATVLEKSQVFSVATPRGLVCRTREYITIFYNVGSWSSFDMA
jgi:hypothetical protein